MKKRKNQACFWEMFLKIVQVRGTTIWLHWQASFTLTINSHRSSIIGQWQTMHSHVQWSTPFQLIFGRAYFHFLLYPFSKDYNYIPFYELIEKRHSLKSVEIFSVPLHRIEKWHGEETFMRLLTNLDSYDHSLQTNC